MRKFYSAVGIILVLILITFISYTFLSAQTKNGFNLENALIPPDKIHSGGPPRDGIPSIDDPEFVKPSEADFLSPVERVLGIYHNQIAKAYPIKIMNWHEIVNDFFEDEPVVVTYCPLCGSGVAYNAVVAGKKRTFGVSGLLYNNDVLLYDRQSESLWSQLMNKGVSGPLKGEKLQLIPMDHTTWSDWKNRYPQTLVLSTNTGYRRDYNRNPYAGYEENQSIMFPVTNKDQKYHNKELVLGVELGDKSKAFPFSELSKADTPVKDVLNGQEIQIHYDQENRTAFVTDPEGNKIPSIMMYWFAWAAFHPEAEVFNAES